MRYLATMFSRVLCVVGALLLSACSATTTATLPSRGVSDGGTVNDLARSATPDGSLPVVSGSPPVDAGSPPADGSPRPQDAAGPADAQASGLKYGADGPYGVTSVSATVNSGSSFQVQIYLPAGDGPFPVVMLSAGLEQPAAAYALYGTRLASWGIIAILRDDPGAFTSTSTIVSDVVYVVGTFIEAQNKLSTSPLFGRVDASKIGLAGHSRGGEVSLLAAETGAKGLVRAMFGLDPVDGSSGTVAATTIASIGIPLAFFGETTDDSALGCAPAKQNFLSLYDAAASPALAITAIGADHTMFEDPASCSFCSFCTAGTATQSVVESDAARYLMAFFARELLGDSSVGAALEGAGIGGDVAAKLVTVVSK